MNIDPASRSRIRKAAINGFGLVLLSTYVAAKSVAMIYVVLLDLSGIKTKVESDENDETKEDP